VKKKRSKELDGKRDVRDAPMEKGRKKGPRRRG